jgi:hypothetical protein
MSSENRSQSDALWAFHSKKFSRSESEDGEEISTQDLWLLAATNNGYLLGSLLRLPYLPDEILLELCQIYLDNKVGYISIDQSLGLTYELAECPRIPRHLFSEFDFDDSVIRLRFWENPATPPSIVYKISKYMNSEMEWQDSVAHVYHPYEMGSRRHTTQDYIDSAISTSRRLRESIRSDEDLAEFNSLFD